MKNFEEQQKIDDLMAAAMLADESGKVMNGVNPQSILSLFDLLREQTNRAVTAEINFKGMLEAEHRLSDAYIRIREICGTIFLPPGSDIWKETEKAASSMAKSHTQFAELAKQKPVAWCPKTQIDLLAKHRMVEADLCSEKRFDEIPLFTRAAPAAEPVASDDELRAQG